MLRANSVTGLKKNWAKMIAPTNVLDCKMLQNSRRRFGFIGMHGNCKMITTSRHRDVVVKVNMGRGRGGVEESEPSGSLTGAAAAEAVGMSARLMAMAAAKSALSEAISKRIQVLRALGPWFHLNFVCGCNMRALHSNLHLGHRTERVLVQKNAENKKKSFN
jgi:hypothetical protein